MELLELFMAAIRRIESTDNYNAIGPHTGRYGRARGAYQIMDANWANWAREAGIPGANWRDPRAQDRVARYKMSQYYRTYKDWDLVAAAWFGGPGAANEMRRRGTSGRRDMLGTSVPSYITKMRNAMQQIQRQNPNAYRTPVSNTYMGDVQRLNAIGGQSMQGGRFTTAATIRAFQQFTQGGQRGPSDALMAMHQPLALNEFQSPTAAALSSVDSRQSQPAAANSLFSDMGDTDAGYDTFLDSFSEMYNRAGAGREVDLSLEEENAPHGDQSMNDEAMITGLLERMGGNPTDPIPLEQPTTTPGASGMREVNLGGGPTPSTGAGSGVRRMSHEAELNTPPAATPQVSGDQSLPAFQQSGERPARTQDQSQVLDAPTTTQFLAPAPITRREPPEPAPDGTDDGSGISFDNAKVGQEAIETLNESVASWVAATMPDVITADGSIDMPALAAADTSTSAGLTFVETAKQFLGTPYVWGGTTPSGFDCSGLIQFVAQQMGVNLPRVSRDQARAGQNVGMNRANWRPGDLIAFAPNGNTVSHIGILAGVDSNGVWQMLHSPRRGKNVEVVPMTRRDVAAVRRVM